VAVPGPFVHDIDPVIFSAWGVHAWWYGFSYTLGFLNAHLALRRNMRQLGLSMVMVYEMTLWLAFGVLAGGRAIVVYNEWAFYREHLALVPALWLGGLATHGLVGGGAAGILAFCWRHRRPVRPIFDALAIPVLVILGCGRVGNFIDGQIVGRVTSLPWGVKFPDAEGFRHPVVLYDALKNFLLIPVLARVRGSRVPPGRIAALFLLLYAGLRIPIDLLREYPLTLLGLPSGQTVNLIMTATGAGLLLKSWLAPRPCQAGPPAALPVEPPHAWQRLAFAAILVLVLVIPSDATRDVPATYGRRHAGLHHTWLYPSIDWKPGGNPAATGRAPARPRRVPVGLVEGPGPGFLRSPWSVVYLTLAR
jgi:phosphatidylglycerol---prolipoprotein diacylglyceryl transferase